MDKPPLQGPEQTFSERATRCGPNRSQSFGDLQPTQLFYQQISKVAQACGFCPGFQQNPVNSSRVWSNSGMRSPWLIDTFARQRKAGATRHRIETA